MLDYRAVKCKNIHSVLSSNQYNLNKKGQTVKKEILLFTEEISESARELHGGAMCSNFMGVLCCFYLGFHPFYRSRM